MHSGQTGVGYDRAAFNTSNPHTMSCAYPCAYQRHRITTRVCIITTIGLLFPTRRHVLREMAERSTIHDHLEKLHTYDTPPAIRDVSQGMITSTVWELVP